MKFTKRPYQISRLGLLLALMVVSASIVAKDSKFTVVIDAGHGGHDPGAIGAISREKDINLSVTLNLGDIIEQKYKDVKVLYTRKTDKYLTLQERADIVNDNHADLFISIHTNSSPSASAFGAECYTMGLAKTKGNLDVAMRENSVITLEDDYKTKYQGFDPRSIDSYIMFEFMQDKYIDRSVSLASIIQKQFISYCNRSDRGVRQAGFMVLHRSACPSVLIELGFISNPAEERYLSSEMGQKEMSVAIFNAFVDYKRDHDKKSGIQSLGVAKFEPSEKKREKVEESEFHSADAPKESKDSIRARQVESKVQPVSKRVSKADKQSETVQSTTQSVAESKVSSVKQPVQVVTSTASQPVFKVQVLASTKKLEAGASDFKGVKDVDCFVEGGFNKYTVGKETDYSKIEKIRKEILSKFPKAFVIAFLGDKKISVTEAMRVLK